MLPSLGRGAADFDRLAADVAAAGYRAVCPEPRGIGRSAVADRRVTGWPTMATTDMASRLLPSLDINSSV